MVMGERGALLVIPSPANPGQSIPVLQEQQRGATPALQSHTEPYPLHQRGADKYLPIQLKRMILVES